LYNLLAGVLKQQRPEFPEELHGRAEILFAASLVESPNYFLGQINRHVLRADDCCPPIGRKIRWKDHEVGPVHRGRRNDEAVCSSPDGCGADGPWNRSVRTVDVRATQSKGRYVAAIQNLSEGDIELREPIVLEEEQICGRALPNHLPDGEVCCRRGVESRENLILREKIPTTVKAPGYPEGECLVVRIDVSPVGAPQAAIPRR